MSKMVRGVLALAFCAICAGPVRAGLNDPIPAPFTKQLFNVPGVINDGVVTVISCSSGLSVSVDVGVETFRKNGTSVAVSTLTVPAGETRNFATGGTTALSIDAVVGGGDVLKSGAARVLSTTTKGIFCNAFVMDPNNDPPQQLMPLLITGVKKQKGQ